MDKIIEQDLIDNAGCLDMRCPVYEYINDPCLECPDKLDDELMIIFAKGKNDDTK